MNMTALRALLEHPRTAMPTKSEELRKLDTALSHGDLRIHGRFRCDSDARGRCGAAR
jgi:hypothetical protein